MKYDKGETKMNKQLILAALMAVFGLSGCTHYYSDGEGPCDDLTNNAQSVTIEETVVDPQTDYICQTSPNSEQCQKDPFVNYTRTAADFRAYGERTPRDHMISKAGAGNNMSASIMPSIENEVIEYEEQINTDPSKVSGTDEVENIVVEDEAAVVEDETTSEVEVEETDTVDEDPVQDWLAEEGQNLKALLTEWSEQSGWRLVWNTNRNYVLSAGAMFRGRFADVSSALIRAFARARPAPIATFYKGNRVLVVETMEDENAYE